MLKPLTRTTAFLTLTIIVIGSFATMAHACPELIEAECAGGSAWFGLRHDGANIAQGHTVTLICDSAVISAEFKFRVYGTPNVGVPSMVAGDEIHVLLLDADGNQITTATTALPSDIYDDWLEFDFPGNFVVPAGQYKIVAYTTVERYCGFHFAYGDGADCYDGGARIASINGLEGPWFDFGVNDAPFRLHVMEGLVANESRVLGSVKGLYR